MWCHSGLIEIIQMIDMDQYRRVIKLKKREHLGMLNNSKVLSSSYLQVIVFTLRHKLGVVNISFDSPENVE